MKYRRNPSSKEKTTILKAATICWSLMLLVTALPVPADNWGVKIPRVDKRFEVLDDFDDEAVRDNETDLVWEKSPDTSIRNWYFARAYCAHKVVGGRKGWKLPSFDQLATLVDPSEANPALPLGHPFIGVQSDDYWTATSRVDFPTEAWRVNFSDGTVDDDSDKLNESFYVWCVRSPHTGTLSH